MGGCNHLIIQLESLDCAPNLHPKFKSGRTSKFKYCAGYILENVGALGIHLPGIRSINYMRVIMSSDMVEVEF